MNGLFEKCTHRPLFVSHLQDGHTSFFANAFFRFTLSHPYVEMDWKLAQLWLFDVNLFACFLRRGANMDGFFDTLWWFTTGVCRLGLTFGVCADGDVN
jgi:hypothetical protein